ncbi:Sec11-like 3, isoform CRA_b [Rozella allomycis CSF55]|uniref:Signal peptidase complex catalytic subunit SEC11 n=1 Tax=Rozella allomycis (strain CSF55) TaxID=988480 RepID=A0A075B4B3_ROZAC|nr:Signal peptidase Sec11-like domain-containing protein [Rozella allomycis CSF55]RKP19372.1 Sec11-like 3, isoform CRA_b [Rozella allomycis CSF55]|eukprot:EPZ36185.1 Signal peptidase Sec11-like domain-containing protein [Rozella allomycis CSF55]
MTQILSFLLVVSSAFMMWKTIGLATNTATPIVVVLSESMSPAFERGDILFLSMANRPLEHGDIVVFELKGKDIPIVHRLMRIHQKSNSTTLTILTKGDNNSVDDRVLYREAVPSKNWLKRKEVTGRVSGYLPYLGYITILMNENPKVKYLVIAIIAFFAILKREQE